MGAGHTFTHAGGGPDPASLEAAVVGVLGAGVVQNILPFYEGGTVTIIVEKLAAAGPFTPAEIANLQLALDAVPDSSPTRSGQATVDKLAPLEKAILLTILDQINVIRSKLSPPLPDITPAQAIAAVRAKM